MKLVRISPEPNRQGRHIVELDDGSKLKLLPSVIGDLGLYAGLELDEAQYARLQEVSGRADTRQRAVRIISAAAVSRRELQDRLVQKGAGREQAEEAVAWLSDLNLLDDAQTAAQIVQRGVSRGYGPRRIRQMLYEKKIPRELWDEALARIPQMDDAVDRFLAGRFRGGRPDQKEIKRAADALARRGYSWGEIKEGLRRYDEAVCREMEDEL